MILATGSLAVLAMVATGLVLFRRLATWLLAQDTSIRGSELALLGLLPGLALVGLLVTALGLLHLFRPWALLAAMGVVLILLPRDTGRVASGLGDGLRAIAGAAGRGDLFALSATVCGIAAMVLGIHLCLMPSPFADVWYYHLPAAHSFIIHHGIIAEQVPHPFYGNVPLLFELLFAVPMLAVDHFAAAGIVNVMIYFGLLLLILSFARRARGFQFLLLLVALVWAGPFFLSGAAGPLTDVPRSCFSVAAFLFAFRYARDWRRFDLAMAALLAGAAVAGKYTELITPMLIGLTLAPMMAARRSWRDLIPAAVLFAAISSFWYIKNAVLYGNPVYPFLFAHPGLSDAWMAGLSSDLGTSVHAEQRLLSRNLLTLQGWRDFAAALLVNFRSLIPAALLAGAGLALPMRRRWILPVWSALLFVIWYVVMFNGRRFAISATLLLLATAFIAWCWILERGLEAWEARTTLAGRRKTAIAFSGACAVLLSLGAWRGLLMPRWIDGDLASTLGGAPSVERQLATTRPGYALYRYIAQHDIGKILHPLSDTGEFEVSAYNQGHDNIWILQPLQMPATPAQTAAFLRAHKVRYFIEPDRYTAPLVPGEVSDPARARALIAQIKPGATLVMRDPSGFSLYALAPSP